MNGALNRWFGTRMKEKICIIFMLAFSSPALMLFFSCSSENNGIPKPDTTPATPQVIRPSAASVPPVSQKLGDAPADASLEILVSLKQKVSPEDQHAAVVKATRPEALERGNLIFMRDIAEKFGATDEAVQIATAHFQNMGKTLVVDPTRTFGFVTLTVEEATRVFGVHFDEYADMREICTSEDRPPYMRCTFIAPGENESVTVPDGLVAALPEKEKPDRYISGLSTRHAYFRKKIRKPVEASGMWDASDPQSVPYWAVSGKPEGCSAALDISPAGFTPSQLREVYHFPEENIKPGMRIAIMELNKCYIQKEDMERLTKCYGLPMPKIEQGDSWATNCSEATLDASAVAAMAPGVDTIYGVSHSGTGTHSDFAATLAALVSQTDSDGKPVDVVSISYDTCEQEIVAEWNASIADLETILRKAAAANITVVVSSGDQGSSACYDGFGDFDGAAVNYPASSAWVTSVGGTNLYLAYEDNRNIVKQTRVWNDSHLKTDGIFFYAGSAGGGGISGTNAGNFPGIKQPEWQMGEGIFTNKDKKRELPDVAFYADQFPGFTFLSLGQWQANAGTSFAAPLFASAILYYNASHTRKMGFANPILYNAIKEKKIKVMDITKGNNRIQVPNEDGSAAPSPADCCDAGPGYDLATGWGSIMVDSLLNYDISGSSASGG